MPDEDYLDSEALTWLLQKAQDAGRGLQRGFQQGNAELFPLDMYRDNPTDVLGQTAVPQAQLQREQGAATRAAWDAAAARSPAPNALGDILGSTVNPMSMAAPVVGGAVGAGIRASNEGAAPSDALKQAIIAGAAGAALKGAGKAVSAVRGEPNYAYHATPESNLSRIKAEGLSPREGGKNFAFKKNQNVLYFSGPEEAPMWAQKLRDVAGEDVARLRTALPTKAVPGANAAVRVRTDPVAPNKLQVFDAASETWIPVRPSALGQFVQRAAPAATGNAAARGGR